MDFAASKPCSQTLQLICRNIGELENIAHQIIRFAGNHTIWLFEGNLGAGKTTLIQAICKAWGVRENVSSPTFSLINEYLSPEAGTIFHFDFYRIKSETEAIDIGAEEYFYSGSPCLIEWGSRIPSLIPPKHLLISISTKTDFSRTIELCRYD
ncbi:tRNA (adenosine(37)-N6)-threonylcarbamoyltransferase complex ATPase subunit type 1 TsaE [Rhodoflexus caldus]|uniref:tRNA (adenosine(37)-N6)-threonylcarbamoyltransferase complex ATPase subunit type 1 TsaE n=1 Tax=Rhodoflexus caldus TaxID=2891236 RepID=UPI00202A72B1|nr:tRNA (adenosine(37)-N6)-threonylcarbamoyltransferase complex ATPase subunit type 1 TsaE [Rhodoflexus caldus]